MADTKTGTYPYELVVEPSKGDSGLFQWSIRKHGKLYQRSDRTLTSENKARDSGMAVIEKLLHGVEER